MALNHILLAVLVMAIWGFNFVVIKVGVADVPPILLAGLRFFLAAIPMVFFVRRPERNGWLWVILYGLTLGFIKFSLVFTGVKLGMPAGLTSIVMQAQAFFTLVLAVFLLGDRPMPVQLAGGAIAVAGLVTIGFDRWSVSGVVPFMMIVAAALAWGVANILNKKAGKVDMLAFIVWASLFATGPLFITSWFVEGPDAIRAALTGMTALSLGAVLFLAYPTTIVGFGIWAWLMARYPASTVAPFSLLVPVFGIASAVLVLGETVSWLESIGAALVLTGLAIHVFGPRMVMRTGN